MSYALSMPRRRDGPPPPSPVRSRWWSLILVRLGAILHTARAAEQARERTEAQLALAAAAVGCALAGGTDIALETSDLVLAKPDLERLVRAHRIARKTMAVVRQNLGWAFFYNAVGIPLAMTGRLTPIYAAAAMALSSLCVVGNSLRITRVRSG